MPVDGLQTVQVMNYDNIVLGGMLLLVAFNFSIKYEFFVMSMLDGSILA